jgi:tRNA A37 N6-isopentenylltransferase MiaA
MKQTAVEFLETELKKRYSLMNSEPLFEQAKEMEKQQIQEAYDHMRCIGNFESGEQYYNEIFKDKIKKL